MKFIPKGKDILIDILICMIIRMLKDNFYRIYNPILNMKRIYFKEHFSSSKKDAFISLNLFFFISYFFLKRTKSEQNHMIKVHFSVTWGSTL